MESAGHKGGVLHMVLADIAGAITITAAIVTIVGGVVTLSPGVRRLVARIWAWVVAPRREREELKRQLKESRDNQDRIEQRVEGIKVVLGKEIALHEAAEKEVAELKRQLADLSARLDADQALAQATAGERMEQYLKEAPQ
jgi:hypothetical protein